MAAPSDRNLGLHSSELFPTFYQSLRQYLEDETFEVYTRHLHALGPGSGRSRPCKLEPIEVLSNHFLLQLGLLRLINGLTWSMLNTFASKLIKIHLCLPSLIVGVEKRAAQLNLSDENIITSFLEEVIDLNYPKHSLYCLKFGVTTAFLLGEEGAPKPQSNDHLPNGLVIELEKFKREKCLSGSDIFSWFSVLWHGLNVSSKQLNNKISGVMKKHEKVSKDKKRRPTQYESFLQAVFDPSRTMRASTFQVSSCLVNDFTSALPLPIVSTCEVSPPPTASTYKPPLPPSPPTASICGPPLSLPSPPTAIMYEPPLPPPPPTASICGPPLSLPPPPTASMYVPPLPPPLPSTASMCEPSLPPPPPSTASMCEPSLPPPPPSAASMCEPSLPPPPSSTAGMCEPSLPPPPPPTACTCEPPPPPSESACKKCNTLQSQLHDMANHLLHFKMQAETHHEIKNHELEPVMEGLRQTLKNKNEQIASLTIQADEYKKELVLTKSELKRTTICMKTKEKECATLKRNATNLRRSAETAKKKKAILFKELRKKDTELKELQHASSQQLRAAEEDGCQRERELKAQIKEQQKEIRCLKKSLNDVSGDKEVLELQLQDQTTPVVNTKEDRRYTDAIQVCTAQLVGELEVAAARVPHIIQCVAKHVFNSEISLQDLPKKTSLFRYVDNAHVVAKMHLSDEMQTKKFDLHTDGTSRNKKSFVGQQVTLENKTSLSCGFHRVSTETAQSLTDVTIGLITELASVSVNDDNEIETEREAKVKLMLQNLNATMSDRASNMKAFNKQLQTAVQDILGTDKGLEFLYCQAHFLLGLSAAADKALSAVEKRNEFTNNLGRDNMPAFSHFRTSASEPAALRALRTACDILGPRGDEKSGCRNFWIGFCSLRGIRSQIGSFRGNRFNNTFEGAAGIIHHLEDIISSFRDYFEEKPNLKIQSVAADLSEKKIITELAALAMVYICVTGPFWVMINSDVHYLDLYQHVQKMQTSLQQVITNSDIFDVYQGRLDSALDTFFLEETPVVHSVMAFIKNKIPDQVLFKELVIELCKEFLKTIDRQLQDFLPGGKYSTQPTEEDRVKMAHCRTTNLLSEACLGDLDFSMNKRRHASSFFHSTINMMKRNKPIKTWFDTKSVEEQKKLMKVARTKGSELRRHHQEKERSVVQEDKDKLVARAQAHQEKTKKQDRYKFKILQDIAACPLKRACITAKDVDELLHSCHNTTSKRDALKLQFRYHRIIMKFKNPLLRIGRKDLAQQVSDLKSFLSQSCGLHPSAFDPVLDHEDCSSDSSEGTSPPPKRRRHLTNCTSSAAKEWESDDSTSCQSCTESDTEDTDISFNGLFRCQGQTVAVYYDEQLFVGEVLHIISPSKATVTFMHQDSDKNSFFWPSSLDIDDVEKQYVVQWDLNLQPGRVNARKWSVEDFKELQRRHRAFKSQFC